MTEVPPANAVGSSEPIRTAEASSTLYSIKDGTSETSSSPASASGGTLLPSADGGPPTPATPPQPQQQQQESLQELLNAGGWSPADVIVSVYYIGVDFEYRRSAKLVGLVS